MTFTYSATSVTLPGSIANSTEVSVEKQQNVLEYEDGSVDVRDRSVGKWFIKLRFFTDSSTANSVRSFMHETIQYQRYAFTFTPDAGIDAGAGAGVAVTARLWQKNYTEKYITSNRVEFSLILRASSTGTAYPSAS